MQHGTAPVQERGVSYLDVTFLTNRKVPYTPVSARYRIDDITSAEREVLDWTDIIITGPTTTITVTGTQNRILSNRNKRERRQVTVEHTGTDGEPSPDTFEYEIINRAGTT